MTRPNGIALSPDEKTLYVANSDPDKAIWMAFPIKADGTLGKGKVIYDATADVKASPKQGAARRAEGRREGEHLRDRGRTACTCSRRTAR